MCVLSIVEALKISAINKGQSYKKLVRLLQCDCEPTGVRAPGWCKMKEPDNRWLNWFPCLGWFHAWVGTRRLQIHVD